MDNALPPLNSEYALFLDIDSSLLDIAPGRVATTIPPELPQLLHRLMQHHGGALALMSGRTLANIERLFGDMDCSNFSIAAEHGSILCSATGKITALGAPAPALAGLISPLRAAVAARPGTALEQKRFGISISWQGASAMGDSLAKLVTSLVVPHTELVTLPTHDGLEIRSRMTDKAGALEAFLRDPPFLGRQPVFIGNDTADERAIARAVELGGLGLHVGRHFSGQPNEVRRWLETGL